MLNNEINIILPQYVAADEIKTASVLATESWPIQVKLFGFLLL